MMVRSNALFEIAFRLVFRSHLVDHCCLLFVLVGGARRRAAGVVAHNTQRRSLNQEQVGVNFFYFGGVMGAFLRQATLNTAQHSTAHGIARYSSSAVVLPRGKRNVQLPLCFIFYFIVPRTLTKPPPPLEDVTEKQNGKNHQSAGESPFLLGCSMNQYIGFFVLWWVPIWSHFSRRK